ncbi:MAG: hypothetical protein AB1689_18720, partial [Thermodesulfobacteriota bacterium]
MSLTARAAAERLRRQPPGRSPHREDGAGPGVFSRARALLAVGALKHSVQCTDPRNVAGQRSRDVLRVEWVPQPSLVLGLAALVGALFGGPLIGIGLAALVAP